MYNPKCLLIVALLLVVGFKINQGEENSLLGTNLLCGQFSFKWAFRFFTLEPGIYVQDHSPWQIHGFRHQKHLRLLFSPGRPLVPRWLHQGSPSGSTRAPPVAPRPQVWQQCLRALHSAVGPAQHQTIAAPQRTQRAPAARCGHGWLWGGGAGDIACPKMQVGVSRCRHDTC